MYKKGVHLTFQPVGLTPLADLTGKRFGLRVVLGRAADHCSANGSKDTYWKYVCDCGKVGEASSINLKRTKSCGCLKHKPLIASSIPVSDKEKVVLRASFDRYKNNALKAGRVFELAFEQFCEIVRKPCVYCNTTPSKGIDRKDNDEGYVVDNAEPCCWICNRAKGQMSHDEFIAWVSRVHDCISCSVA